MRKVLREEVAAEAEGAAQTARQPTPPDLVRNRALRARTARSSSRTDRCQTPSISSTGVAGRNSRSRWRSTGSRKSVGILGHADASWQKWRMANNHAPEARNSRRGHTYLSYCDGEAIDRQTASFRVMEAPPIIGTIPTKIIGAVSDAPSMLVAVTTMSTPKKVTTIQRRVGRRSYRGRKQ